MEEACLYVDLNTKSSFGLGSIAASEQLRMTEHHRNLEILLGDCRFHVAKQKLRLLLQKDKHGIQTKEYSKADFSL